MVQLCMLLDIITEKNYKKKRNYAKEKIKETDDRKTSVRLLFVRRTEVASNDFKPNLRLLYSAKQKSQRAR